MPATNSIDYTAARELLESTFADVEKAFLAGRVPSVPRKDREACDAVFASKTQAYREVLLGCTLARLLNPAINIRLPYVDMAPDAFSGRTLDEKVVNPFLTDKRLPCSKGPFLSVFRRSVRFDESTRAGLRDKSGYDALLDCIARVVQLQPEALINFLKYQLHGFAELREAASIPLSRLQRISLEQYDRLLSRLLLTASGGLFPVLFTTAMFRTLNAVFSLAWDIQVQGINVADAATGAGGDITVSRDGRVMLAVEVTERQVGRSRVVTTFNTKIAPASIEDYVFLTATSAPSEEAREQARRYFAQGHEVNFLDLREWMIAVLATVGREGRDCFNAELMALLDSGDVPQVFRRGGN